MADEQQPEPEPLLGQGLLIPDLHTVQVLFDGKVIREDTNVTEARLLFHRNRCTNPECEASHANQYTWSIECDTLTELDMTDGIPQ